MPVDKWEVPQPIYQFLATTGKGATTGHSNAIGDYSTATGTSGESFIIAPSTGEAYRIHRMMIHVQDTGVFAAEKYGALTELTNGVAIRVETDTGTVHDLTGTVPVKTNAQWGRHCYDVRVDTWGVGDEFLSARWTFSNGGYPLRLDGDRGERLVAYLQDSCTGLGAHDFFVHGYVEDDAFDHWQ